ncbi:hypothetical protein C2S51_011565 [Perilla frutescens var. frutescens]|nr:hypothetical protein C2S51_011565 [Perilla frutescens var. frutescens]
MLMLRLDASEIEFSALIERSNGEWVQEPHEMLAEISSFFGELFTTSAPSKDDITKLSNSSQITLDEPFTAAEVRRELFQMHLSKSPGPDGFSARFYQKFWPAIGEAVTNAVLGVLNHGKSLQDWNKTLIVLIPKCDQPRKVKEYRPISLCNTAYKLVSKVVVSRLRRVLHEVVDENQSAFISGRQITDNISVGFECMHWLQNMIVLSGISLKPSLLT